MRKKNNQTDPGPRRQFAARGYAASVEKKIDRLWKQAYQKALKLSTHPRRGIYWRVDRILCSAWLKLRKINAA